MFETYARQHTRLIAHGSLITVEEECDADAGFRDDRALLEHIKVGIGVYHFYRKLWGPGTQVQECPTSFGVKAQYIKPGFSPQSEKLVNVETVAAAFKLKPQVRILKQHW